MVETAASEIGERFVRAVVDRDRAALLAVLTPEVDFRGMTPGDVWRATSARALVDDVLFARWFEPTDHVDAIEGIETSTVVDRHRIGYRLRMTNDDGTFAVEQQAYYEVEGNRIGWLRILCSGCRELPAPATEEEIAPSRLESLAPPSRS